MALRDLLKDIHNEAENTEFAKLLMSGEMSPELYGLYLNNQFHIYSALENRACEFPFYIKKLKSMGRMMALEGDRCGYVYPDKMLPTTKKYVKYASQLRQDQVIAHLYVRHFGDMYGGAMIKSKIPKCNKPSTHMHTDGLYYNFPDKSSNISTMRALLSDDMANECKIVFQYAIDLFKELMDYDIPEAYISSIGSPGVAGIEDRSQAST